MLALLPLVMELLGLVPQAIQLGIDITASVEKAIALYNASAPVTQPQLDELKAMIGAESAKLAAMTTDLNTDPAPGNG